MKKICIRPARFNLALLTPWFSRHTGGDQAERRSEYIQNVKCMVELRSSGCTIFNAEYSRFQFEIALELAISLVDDLIFFFIV